MVMNGLFVPRNGREFRRIDEDTWFLLLLQHQCHDSQWGLRGQQYLRHGVCLPYQVQEVVMDQPVCPVCTHRVSDWQIAAGKTIAVAGSTYHKACLINYRLQTGIDFLTDDMLLGAGDEMPKRWLE
jgi:hypothetical protein